MREPRTPTDDLWKDFLFPHVGVVPIQLTGEGQPVLSAEHASSFAPRRVGRRMALATWLLIAVCARSRIGKNGRVLARAKATLAAWRRQYSHSLRQMDSISYRMPLACCSALLDA